MPAVAYNRMPKQYGYLSDAAGTITGGIGKVVGAYEKDREMEMVDQQLKRQQYDRQQANEVRKNRIAEAAAEYHDAAGLPDDEDGWNSALSAASATYYPIMSTEEPSAAVRRMAEADQKSWPSALNKAKMERYRRETASQITQVEGGKAGTPEAMGTVGIQDEGVTRTPAFPQSKEEMIAQRNQEVLSEPRLAPTVTREATAGEAYDLARNIGISQEPTVREDIGYRGRQELTQGEYPTGTMMEDVQRDVYANQPIVQPESEKYAKTYPVRPKTPTELDQLKIDKIKAQIDKLKRSGGKGDASNTDKNIRWATDRVDDLSASIIKNNEKINRLRQARVRLQAGQKLSLGSIKGLDGLVSNPENPDLNEINQQIDQLQTLVNTSEQARDYAETTIKELSKGKSLTQARGKEVQVTEQSKGDKVKNDITKARSLIRTDPAIKNLASRGSLTDVLNILPEELQETMFNQVENLRNNNFSDEQILQWFSGKK